MNDKILVIDDDESIRQSLKNLLSRLGYFVLTAESGNSGLELIRKYSPDLVISDIRMPGLTGLELLKRIKELNINSKVILITAHDDVQTTIESIQNGAYEYFEKPLNIEKLKIAVHRALESKSLSERLGSFIEEEAEEFQM